MKKAIVFIYLFILTVGYFSICAQEAGVNRSNYWYYYDLQNENEQSELNKKNALRQKTVITKYSHSQRTITVFYNTSGRVSLYKNKNREVKIKYTAGSQKQEIMTYKKGRLISRDSCSWNGKTLDFCLHYNKQNELKTKQSYKYDSAYVKESKFEKVKKGKLREVNKTVYEYYPDHSYKKITYYKKGRPSYYSVFDCNPIGEKHKIEKDSSYSCIKYDVDSLGNKIKVSVTNEKKYSRKRIEYFNEKDQRVAQKIYDLKKDQILWHITYKPGSAWALTNYVTYKKGKENYRQENVYNEKDQCTSWTTYSKGKLNSKSINTYNSKGMLEKSEWFNKRNKKTAESNWVMEFY